MTTLEKMENLNLTQLYFYNLLEKYFNDNINKILSDHNLSGQKLDYGFIESKFDLIFDQIDENLIDCEYSVTCYSSDKVTHVENCIYCDFSGHYFNNQNYFTIEVEGFRQETYLSSYYLDSLDIFGIVILYNGEYHNENSCVYVEEEAEHYLHEDCYYWESDGEHHLEPEPEDEDDSEGVLFNYHGSHPVDLSDKYDAKVGFEVEKEDCEIRSQINAYELQNTSGWGAERDSSLNESSGFELVSPIFDLSNEISYFKDEFLKIASLLNAECTRNCGGHINYSDPNFLDSEALFDEIKGYIPLLYSIYPTRINNNYSKGKTPSELKYTKERHQSIRFKDNGILEFRIFSRVKNINQLLWRVGLIKIIHTNKQSNSLNVLNDILDSESILHLHLRSIYSFETLVERAKTFVKILQTFGEVELTKETLNLIETKINNLKK